MTITEVSEKYKIPIALLQRYATEKTEAKGTDKSKGRRIRTGLRKTILNS